MKKPRSQSETWGTRIPGACATGLFARLRVLGNVPTPVHPAQFGAGRASRETYNQGGRKLAQRRIPMAPTPSIPACLQRATVLLISCGLFATAAQALRSHGGSAFARAESQREALESKPQAQRTQAAYERVLDAYRAIYHANPASPEADASVNAVASLLAEEGRALHEARLLHESIAQFEYLRRNYPASHFRQSALLSEAEIAQSDLQDYPAARQSFSEFLRLYPSSPLAGEARQQLKAVHRAEQAHATALPQSEPAVLQQDVLPAQTTRAQQAARNAAQHARELAELNGAAQVSSTNPQLSSPAPVPMESAPPLTGNTKNGGVFITGIRHWSTPVYTRVAIDLSDQVQYEAARVPDPDRIYFDLHGARLAPSLTAKSMDVSDTASGGFLRRIRIAPSSGNTTRVVLDVSHVSEYSAFFLPNPWRLIVDIHGSLAGTGANQASPVSNAQVSPPTQLAATSSAAPSASAESSQDVNALAHAPRRVKATQHPTTAPIAASVSGTTRAPQTMQTQKPNELDALAALSNPPDATAVPSELPAPESAPARTRHRNASASSPPTTVPTDITPQTPTLAAREATPTATGERSLARALGLKVGRIVIDAGHGGHDSGTLGPQGIEEKDVVLDVSLRLGKLLKQRLGADVIYTRDDDTFIPLETRTAIANKAQADLFISVHANSSSDPSARGVEVYYLNFTTSPEALEVAARENAVSDQSIYQLSDLVKKITLKDKIDESHEFASDVETSLYGGLASGNEGLKDRGVKKAPFVVLIGANMPSILAEISFLTNPEDARKLRDPDYRERIAESLYRGVSRYVSGLSGMRLAQNGRHSTGTE